MGWQVVLTFYYPLGRIIISFTEKEAGAWEIL
jgi:hypothetical protein